MKRSFLRKIFLLSLFLSAIFSLAVQAQTENKVVTITGDATRSGIYIYQGTRASYNGNAGVQTRAYYIMGSYYLYADYANGQPDFANGFSWYIASSITSPATSWIYSGWDSGDRMYPMSTGPGYSWYWSDFSGFEVTVTVSDTYLPVELTSFIASFIDNKVTLNWQTATEVNNYGFSIERSVILSPDPVGAKNLLPQDWQNIGFVNGHGNSNSTKQYSFVDKDVASGNYSYRLKQIDTDGSYSYSNVVEVTCNMQPTTFELYQNYPNPFNPTTTIKYSIPAAVETGHAPSLQYVSLNVYDILGNEVATLVNEPKEPGIYEVEFDASQLASGLYIYIINAGEFSSIKKLLLMK